jgi:hypothetical protein
MKNSEEAIGKVLGGLRDAEAPAGMERRILDGLAERVALRSRWGWRRLLPIWLVAPERPIAVGSLVCGVALAGLFAVALAIPAIRRLGHSPASMKRGPAPAGSLALGGSEAGATNPRPASPRSGLRSLEEIKGKMEVEGKARSSEAAVLDSDAVALDDLHAASRPAPPMPLTEQEKLLLRLVHKDDLVELAMLDPRVRAMEDSEDRAEFQRFFGQSAKQSGSEQTMTEQATPQQSTTEPATEQGALAQPGTEGATPEQAVPEEAVPEQPTQQPSTPEKFATDQSITQPATTQPTTTQQRTPRPTKTGENE